MGADFAELQAEMNIYNLTYYFFHRGLKMDNLSLEEARCKQVAYLLDKIFEYKPSDDLDQVTCARCGFQFYKDDCARTTDGGWICESCQEKYDGQDEKGGEDGE